jgi:pimeloyl-ACP methyl ester carboxylesterase
LKFGEARGRRPVCAERRHQHRLVLFDKPGTGLSDPVPAAPTIDQRTADVVAVMDAVGSERAVVGGYSEGGVPATTLTATRPERVEALVLLSTHRSRTPWRRSSRRSSVATSTNASPVRHSCRFAARTTTTVVFTDLVDSTRQLAQLGDATWRTVLAEHAVTTRTSVTPQQPRSPHDRGSSTACCCRRRVARRT